MEKSHQYHLTVNWTGNLGKGTSTYTGYSRNHVISAAGKSTPIQGSSDSSFRGQPERFNPEELLVAALSACHMLWFLHLCANAGIAVIGYSDSCIGNMIEHADGSGEFTSVTLYPVVTIADESRAGELAALHSRAHSLCFIARSVRFPVKHVPTILRQ